MVRKSNGWVIVINNPTEYDMHMLWHFYNNKMQVEHCIIGNEGFIRAPFSGGKPRTPHMQCAVWFTAPQSFKDLKRVLPRAYLDQLKFDYTAAVSYCRKEGYFMEVGDQYYAQRQQDLLRNSKMSEPERNSVYHIPTTRFEEMVTFDAYITNRYQNKAPFLS